MAGLIGPHLSGYLAGSLASGSLANLTFLGCPAFRDLVGAGLSAAYYRTSSSSNSIASPIREETFHTASTLEGGQLGASLIQKRWMSSSGPVSRGITFHKRGADVLHDPWWNKGTAFPASERDRLGIRGLLPPRQLDLDQQKERFMKDYRKIEDKNGSKPMACWRMLNRLHDRNETMYYSIIINHIKEMAPIIYTPTVGQVCQTYSSLYRRPRGMYFSARDRGEMAAMIWNWPAEEVDMIVVTDGSRILGLGDLGVQGIGIPIGKLDLYVAGAGLNPRRILPIQIDVGTNNQGLLDNPLYLGLHQNRLEGEEYEEVIDEFMEAVFLRWPKCIVQFEDFQNKWAFKLLKKYRNSYRMFNDDVQGTACVGLAGILGALRAMGKPMSELPKSRFLIVGAGSAGMGVVEMTRQNMAKSLGGGPEAEKNAAKQFWLTDKDGLITKDRRQLDELFMPYARPGGELGLKEGSGLLEVVKAVKPDFLIGLSGVPQLFTPEVLKVMAEKERPVIFPMSNPTSKAEATAEQVFKATNGRAVFASGSPFPPVKLDDGRVCMTNQGNNMYMFPGIGLGTMLAGATNISDGMLHAATERLASLVPEEEARQGTLYPPLESIRTISQHIACAVIEQALKEELAEGARGLSVKELQALSPAELLEWVATNQWGPQYVPLIYDPKF